MVLSLLDAGGAEDEVSDAIFLDERVGFRIEEYFIDGVGDDDGSTEIHIVYVVKKVALTAAIWEKDVGKVDGESAELIEARPSAYFDGAGRRGGLGAGNAFARCGQLPIVGIAPSPELGEIPVNGRKRDGRASLDGFETMAIGLLGTAEVEGMNEIVVR